MCGAEVGLIYLGSLISFGFIHMFESFSCSFIQHIASWPGRESLLTPSGGLGPGYNGRRRLLFWHQPLVAAAAEWRSRELPQLPGSLLLHHHLHALRHLAQPDCLCQAAHVYWRDTGAIFRRNSKHGRGGAGTAAGHLIQLNSICSSSWCSTQQWHTPMSCHASTNYKNKMQTEESPLLN